MKLNKLLISQDAENQIHQENELLYKDTLITKLNSEIELLKAKLSQLTTEFDIERAYFKTQYTLTKNELQEIKTKIALKLKSIHKINQVNIEIFNTELSAGDQEDDENETQSTSNRKCNYTGCDGSGNSRNKNGIMLFTKHTT